MENAPLPKVFISYSHDDKRHEDRVLKLADRLRQDGIDAEIDQYETAPREAWPAWCERQIKSADFVLLVCTETYLRRVDGNEAPGMGHGVLWEARIIRQLLYEAGSVSAKFVPVLYSDCSVEHIPMPVRGGTQYFVDTEAGYEELYRQITNQPRVLRPKLGKLRPLPPKKWQPEARAAAQSERHARVAAISNQPSPVNSQDQRLIPRLVAKLRRIFVTPTGIALFACALLFLLLVLLTWQHPLSTFVREDGWQRLSMIMGLDDPPPAMEATPGITYLGSQTDDKKAVQLDREASRRFAMDTEIPVQVKTFDYRERLNDLKKLGEGEGLYDVITLDIVWIGELSDVLLDLSHYFSEADVAKYDPEIIANNTFNGKLLAIPWFKDIGVLFYRMDLLDNYGERVPDTWQNLEDVAWKIQEGEKAYSPDFIGFAWQGASYEGLTCNALEWIASWGGIDAKTGLLDRAAARTALEHAKAWVKGPRAISEGVEKDTEANSLDRFLSGKAAFFRSWQNAYGNLSGHDNWRYGGNGCAKNEKCFGVSPLPRGNGDNNASVNATVIGGWQLAVPKNSRHKPEALEFIRYATNEEVQAWRAHKGGYIPTITKLNDDNRVMEGTRFLRGAKFKNVKEFARPFNRAEYEVLSTCFSSAAHSALFDKSDKTGNGVEAAIEKMQNCGIIHN